VGVHALQDELVVPFAPEIVVVAASFEQATLGVSAYAGVTDGRISPALPSAAAMTSAPPRIERFTGISPWSE
jgi:hypothetical protein